MPKPTTGRIINYWPTTGERQWNHNQPLAAQITYVWDDNCVNLSIKREDGSGTFGRTSVRLVDHDIEGGPQPGQCSWFPIQQTTDKLANTIPALQARVAELIARSQAMPSAPDEDDEDDDGYSDADIGRFARICHEANRALCQAFGDGSQPAWDDAPEWQRKSAMNGVRLHLGNPNAGPQASHESWMAEKLADGWVYGPVKNADSVPPTHPCLVPFDQLSPYQQSKDYVFRAIVHAVNATIIEFDDELSEYAGRIKVIPLGSFSLDELNKAADPAPTPA